MEDHVDKDNTVDSSIMEGTVEDSFIEDSVKEDSVVDGSVIEDKASKCNVWGNLCEGISLANKSAFCFCFML